ncbi:hypothetical protein [Halopiger goleimassiliensis]|uniref:hypothetical protein n=1 Tax=Halopiger goleimassiliensis TaxID=1293048 RepID=UPI000677C02C|nr:hypothetical protein [Halopiger goleimassiliensis]
MVTTSTIRVVAWTASLVTAGAAFGMDWAIQTVEIPLWALLVVTFVPTRDLVDATIEILDAVVQKMTPADSDRP